MAVAIHIKDVMKKYEDNVVIRKLTADMKPGELFTLLGPSGCGKTTLLRMIAGFNTVEHGTIAFDDQVINNIPVYKRNFGMVFQNYAIFPNMTVYKNIEYGLKNKKLNKQEIRRRVEEIMETVQITQYKDRYPDKLSGGQQQRVALARAIVVQPQVLLMDEPLSNLDAKLRIEMREAIREVQKKIGITTVYVTHDQEEALAISDRIAVMNKGDIQQIETPENIYSRPYNTFVAEFIGHSNRFLGNVVSQDAAGRSDTVGVVQLPQFTIGKLTVTGYVASVFHSTLTRSYDAILGFDLFNKGLCCKIDTRHKRMILTDRRDFFDGEKGYALHYTLKWWVPYVMVSPFKRHYD